jgi:pyruvate,water dikinase
LEQQMWVEPLRDGVVAALRKTGAITASTSSTDLVRVVAGHVVVDLEAFGYLKHRSPLGLLDPRPPLHRLGLAWKVGRLRADLSDRAADRTRTTDEWLAQVPSLTGATDEALLALIDESRARLVDVHRDEVLVGTLSVSSSRTAAADALSRLSMGRARGLTDEQIIATDPVTLALVPARVGALTALPATRGPGEARSMAGSSELSAREALRLRARWLQELQARTAAELGRRWAEAGALGSPDDIALLGLDELRALQGGAPLPDDLTQRADKAAGDTAAAPLPSQFRLAGDGSVVPAARRGARRAGGVGAGGGRGSGSVSHGDALHPPCAGDVLVVRDLSPALAPFLPGLAGVVSESGSTLSHLAILAREYGVPTVVAAHDALQRFPEGTRLLVDGRTGELSVLEEDA